MAQARGRRPGRRSGTGGSRSGRAAQPKQAGAARGGARRPNGQKPAERRSGEPERSPETPRSFRLGVVPGATPGKWIDRWNERMPRVPLELVPLDVDGQRQTILSGAVDAAIVRRPIDDEGLHLIPLYEELPVVVMSAESELTVAEELTAGDLDGEVLIVPGDDVLGPLDLPGTEEPRFDRIETTADVIATVAAGVGITVVPMSLARLHHRRDVEYRPLRGGPLSAVALAWPRDRDSDDIQTFVGIVRGRTANSSR